MVPMPWPSDNVAPTTFVRFTEKVSSGSTDVSPFTVTDTVRVVAPAVKVSAPEAAA